MEPHACLNVILIDDADSTRNYTCVGTDFWNSVSKCVCVYCHCGITLNPHLQSALSTATRSLNVMSTHCEIVIKKVINKWSRNTLTGLDRPRDIQLIKILWSIRNFHGEGDFSALQHRDVMKLSAPSFVPSISLYTVCTLWELSLSGQFS